MQCSIRRIVVSVLAGAGVGLCIHQLVTNKKSCTHSCLSYPRSLFILPAIMTFMISAFFSSRNLEFVPTGPMPPSIPVDITCRIVSSSNSIISRCLSISLFTVLLSVVIPLPRSPSIIQTAYLPFLTAVLTSLLHILFDSVCATVLTYPMDFTKLELHTKEHISFSTTIRDDKSSAYYRHDNGPTDSPAVAFLTHCLQMHPSDSTLHHSTPLLSSDTGRNGSSTDVARHTVNHVYHIPWHRPSPAAAHGTLPKWQRILVNYLEYTRDMLTAITLATVPPQTNPTGHPLQASSSWSSLTYRVPPLTRAWIRSLPRHVPPPPTTSSTLLHKEHFDRHGDTPYAERASPLLTPASTPPGTIHRSRQQMGALQLLCRSLALHDINRVARASPNRRRGIYSNDMMLDAVMMALCGVIDTTTLQVSLTTSNLCYVYMLRFMSISRPAPL